MSDQIIENFPPHEGDRQDDSTPHGQETMQVGEAAYRMLPHNLEAEQGLLGALLVDNRALEKVTDFLKESHFFVPAHQRIYNAILTLVERGQTASPVTLKGYFQNDEDLKEAGGSEYLAELAGSVVSVINAADYGHTIYDLYMRRELITLGEDIVNDSYDHSLDRDATNTIEEAESRLFSMAESGDTKGGFVTLRDSVMTAIEHAETAFNADGHCTGVTTGLTDMDKKLGGHYLQLLRGNGGRQSSENRVLEVSEITRGLKAIAKELEIPVLALSQLSRQVENREDKRPMLADLRESGSIEQDADVVMFVYREEYYLSRTEPDPGTEKHMQWQEAMERSHGISECIVAKQRHGPIGTVRMHFDPNFTRFSDLDESHDPYDE